jgi:hypothetical protein
MRLLPVLASLAAISSAWAGSSPLASFPAPTGPASVPHSHNDFAQKRPLDLALENGYRSLEVDVTDRWGEIRVTHLGFFTDGSLKEMYLDRLQKIVDEKGSVLGDGKRFYLWIEVRPFVSSEGIVAMLKELLPKYPMFAKFAEDGSEVSPGAVEAILINSSRILSKYFEGSEPKPACRGIGGFPAASAPKPRFARWIHAMWDSAFSWQGNGPMPKEEQDHLAELQSRAHAKGLRTRFWAAPDEDGFWRKIAGLPFDLVGTDHLGSTMSVVRSVIGGPARKLASSPRDR